MPSSAVGYFGVICCCSALLVNMCGMVVLVTVCCLSGMVVYVKYRHCNPITAGRIDAKDQVRPVFMLSPISSAVASYTRRKTTEPRICVIVLSSMISP